MRVRALLVSTVGVATLVAGCGGGSGGGGASGSTTASLGRFCAEMRADQTQLNAGGAPEYAKVIASFDRLQRTAPSDIEPDVVTVDSALKTAQGSPGRALAVVFDPTYLNAVRRFSAYATTKCGITVSKLSTPSDDAVPAAAAPATSTPPPLGPDRANANLPDPCRLVSQATATAFFESPASQARNFGTLGRECDWVATEGARTQRLRVWVVGDPFFYGTAMHPNARSVTGVGDRAFVDAATPLPGVMVSVQKGTRVVQLTYSEHDATGVVDVSGRTDALVAIAKQAVGAIT